MLALVSNKTDFIISFYQQSCQPPKSNKCNEEAGVVEEDPTGQEAKHPLLREMIAAAAVDVEAIGGNPNVTSQRTMATMLRWLEPQIAGNQQKILLSW
jgi:hypothetical protein